MCLPSRVCTLILPPTLHPPARAPGRYGSTCTSPGPRCPSVMVVTSGHHEGPKKNCFPIPAAPSISEIMGLPS